MPKNYHSDVKTDTSCANCVTPLNPNGHANIHISGGWGTKVVIDNETIYCDVKTSSIG